MFGRVIYFDEEKINEYKSAITGKKSISVSKIAVSNDKDASLNIPIGNGSVSVSENYSKELKDSLLLECYEFEKVLGAAQVDYVDFTISDMYDIETMPRGNIIRFDGILEIPDGFDMSETLHQYGKFFLADDDEFSALLKDKSPKIPILVDLNNSLLCAKIDINKLKIEYVELEDYENVEITILARVISSNKISKSKAIYDPLKDYITLNRQMRRQLENDRPEELTAIYADEDYHSIEIIAMYQ